MGDYYRHFLTSVSEVPGYFVPSSEGLDLTLGVEVPYRCPAPPCRTRIPV